VHRFARQRQDPVATCLADPSTDLLSHWCDDVVAGPGAAHWSGSRFAPILCSAFRARATDAAGNVQAEVPPWNRLGYGKDAIELIYVYVC
jgi:hypothetical protein